MTHSLQTVRKARIMREAGWTYRKIGEALNVPHTTLVDWCNPSIREARRERGRKRLERERVESAKRRAAELWEAGLPMRSIVYLLANPQHPRQKPVKVSHTTLKSWLPEERTKRPRGAHFGGKLAA